MKKTAWIDRLVWWANLLAMLVLLLSYLSPFVSPAILAPVAFPGLLYPLILAINLLFVGYWIIRKKRRLFFSLAVIALGYTHLQNTIQLDGSDKLPEGEQPIRVMSYNVRLFDLYNWSQNTQTRDRAFEFLRKQNPDILCFQEYFYSSKKNYFNTTDTLRTLLSATRIHDHFTRTVHRHHNFGIATFSRYPIIQEGVLEFGSTSNNVCIFTDLKIDQDTVRVYNMHLASLHFGKQDYEFLEEIGEAENEERIRGVRQIYRLVNQAFQKRAAQAELIAEHIRSCPHPVIVCGDFNDTPSSYSYRTISEGLVDGFIESGWGIGTTYNGRLPLLRIDHLLHSPELKGYNFTTQHEDFSDHYPLEVSLVLGE